MEHILQTPLIMESFTDSWPCHSWTFEMLASVLGKKLFSCRISEKTCSRMMETQCVHKDVTLGQFSDWFNEEKNRCPLSIYARDKYSCYIDYKYMKDMFSEHPEYFDHVQWKNFGLNEFNGYDSTIWLGSEGANTPGHQDTYGFNLVTQILGRKLWILFPPEDSAFLYQTRVPYEESSVFTQVNIRKPDLSLHPKFKLTHPVVVTLSPGQTLYVPRHWWHYVESLEPSISVNVWIPSKYDHLSQLEEAVTRCLATSLLTTLDTSGNKSLQQKWLNPTENLDPMDVNLTFLKTAMFNIAKNQDVHEQNSMAPEEGDVTSQRCDHKKSNSDDSPAGPIHFTEDDKDLRDNFTRNSPGFSSAAAVTKAGDDYLNVLADRLKCCKFIPPNNPYSRCSDRDLKNTLKRKAGSKVGNGPQKRKAGEYNSVHISNTAHGIDEDTAHGINEDTAHGINEDTAHGINEDTAHGIDEDTAHGIDEDTAHGIDEDTAHGIDEDTAHGIDEDTAHGIDEDTAHGIDEDTAHGINEDTAHGIDEDTAHGIDDDTAHGIDQDTAHGINEDTAHGIDEDTAHGIDEDTAHGIDEDTAHGIDEDTAHGIDEDTAHGIDEDTATTCSKEMEERVFTFRPCPVGSYMKFVSSLCEQNHCVKCGGKTSSENKSKSVNVDHKIGSADSESTTEGGNSLTAVDTPHGLHGGHDPLLFDSSDSTVPCVDERLSEGERSPPHDVLLFTHEEMAESLLVSVLHPDVVKLIGDKLREQWGHLDRFNH